MTMAAAMPRMIDRVPAARGQLVADAPMAALTWFRVGGPADVLFSPADAQDLCDFLAALPDDVPVTVVGLGSNLLVRDGGVPGVVIRLGRPFGAIETDGMTVHAGAGAPCRSVALAARDAGIDGFAFLVGIPGTIGGALRMNAGAYGAEMKDILSAAEAVDRHGRRHRLGSAELGFGYRRSALAEDWIVLAATLAGHPGEAATITRRMAEIDAERKESQPIPARTGGSTFKNPPGRRAWELIDAAGCRGLEVGGAKVSTRHCNFLINTGSATAADIEALGEEVRARVRAATGVALEWEIRRVGIAAPGDGR